MSSVRLLDLGVVGLASGLGFGKAGVCSTYYVTDCAQLKLVGQGGVGGACKLVVQCMVGQLPGGATMPPTENSRTRSLAFLRRPGKALSVAVEKNLSLVSRISDAP